MAIKEPIMMHQYQAKAQAAPFKFLDSTDPVTEAKRDSGLTLMEEAFSMTQSSAMKMVLALLETMALTLAVILAPFNSKVKDSVAKLALEVSPVEVVATPAPFLETKVPLETLTSLEISLAAMVTPKTAARQATVRTDPTTTAAFMVLTDPSTLDNCPLRLDIVLLLSESIMIVFCLLVTSVFEFVFVKVRERK